MFAIALLALGGIFVLLSADWRNEAIAPGPLAQSHAQLFSRDGGDSKCSACHAAADDGSLAWAAGAVGIHNTTSTQSQLCLKCHAEFISSKFAFAAHNVPSNSLLELTGARTGGNGSFTRVVQAAFWPGEELACATCHREHHGSHTDLTAIDNQACQACHQQRYESFAADHPEFGIWPYERRTRIAFNHASHQSKHFVEKSQSFDCRKCHMPDATRSIELTANYEAACAECHDEKIATSVARGVPLFAVPSLDVEVLRAAGHDIGPWPEDASGDFDGQLPPAMKLLLKADAGAADAIDTLGHDFDFFDVDIEDPKQLKACADIAAAVKTLLADVSEQGSVILSERLSIVLGHEVNDKLLAALFSGMSAYNVRHAVVDWLQLEVAEGQSSNGPTISKTVTPGKVQNRFVPALAPGGTWQRDDATLSIRYHPSAHADPVLMGWLELMASLPVENRSRLTHAVFNELVNPAATGLCVSCHSVEQLADGGMQINWRASNPVNEPRSFTRFSHRPHLALPQLADCMACHAIDGNTHDRAAYVGTDPCKFVSDFLPVTKRLCADCHTHTAAGDQCQSCHNYHIGSRAEKIGLPLRPLTGTSVR